MQQFFIKLAEHAVEEFTWDLHIEESGVAMFLDVPYHNKYKRQEDHLTLGVNRVNGQNRPRFISFILPNYLNKENGIFLFFTKNETNGTAKEFTIKPYERTTIRLRFESETDDTITARIQEGYVK